MMRDPVMNLLNQMFVQLVDRPFAFVVLCYGDGTLTSGSWWSGPLFSGSPLFRQDCPRFIPPICGAAGPLAGGSASLPPRRSTVR